MISTPESRAGNYVFAYLPEHVTHVVSLHALHEVRTDFPATRYLRQYSSTFRTELAIAHPGTHGDVGGHWQSNALTQQISFSLMVKLALEKGVPFEYRGIESDLLRYKQSTYFPAGIWSQFNEEYSLEKWLGTWDPGLWKPLSDRQVYDLATKYKDVLDWKPGPFGIQKKQGTNIKGYVQDYVVDRGMWSPFYLIHAIRSASDAPQLRMEHMPRNLDWAMRIYNRKIYYEFDKKFFDYLAKLRANDSGIGGWQP